MDTSRITRSVSRLLAELVDGTAADGQAFVLNSGDAGLLRSLEKLSAAEASSSANAGATIAAHAQHLRYGLSLMNQWIREGDNPFANARWDEAWKVSAVDEASWREIRNGLADEIRQWREALETPRDLSGIEVTGVMSSVVHLAYHVGAIRQIARTARGPREGTFK